MAEYIEREAVLKMQYWEGCGRIRYGVVAVADIENVPAADVVEVRRGRWVSVQNGKGCCSECHRLDAIDPIATHCRYCGARMDGECR